MKHYQIFISYRRDGGADLAGRLADRFTAMGYTVFFDVESMRSGEFNTQLLDAIQMCQDVLLILPPHGLDRCADPEDWVRQELVYALAQKKNIIPVMMRGFEFPKNLPEALAFLPFLQGVSASNDYFDAVIQKIESLLDSHAVRIPVYQPETRELFPIRTPLFSSCKPYGRFPDPVFHLEQHLHSIDAAGKAYTSGREVTGLDALFASATPFDWAQHRKRMEAIREKAIILKACTKGDTEEPNLYYYANAVAYAYHLLRTLPNHYWSASVLRLTVPFCYCVDLPDDEYFPLAKAADSYRLIDHLRHHLIRAVEYWPNEDGSNAGAFDPYAITLFDFMLDCALLLNEIYRDPQNMAAVRDQILAYYKYLKKHKLYLPKELQMRIYEHLN